MSFETYDVIVVGSGPAGATVARQLAGYGKKSLIIETGALEFDGDLHTAYSKLYATGHFSADHWPNHWIRTFGGTSSVWSGWCIPLIERNLELWPIKLDDLSQYYEKAAGILGRSKDFLTYEVPFMTGFRARPYSGGDPLRIDEAYAGDFRKSASVDVLLRTNVTELYANEARSAITGFRIFNAVGEHRDVSLTGRQELVLAAGGIGNPHILLSSFSGGRVAVGNENGQVGRYLMEHPHFYDAARMVVAPDLIFEELPPDFGEGYMTVVPEDAVFEQYGRLDASLELKEDAINDDDNVEHYIGRTLGGSAIAYDITVRSEMPPDPENRVQLAEGRDPSGMPRVRVRCMIAGDAMRAVDNYLRHIGETLAQQNKGRIRIDNQAIYRGSMGGGHVMGTTRMGNAPQTSVVDKNCRVHGYGNLSIAGSSTFTTGGYANPTLTIVALAVRLADHLSENA